VGSELCLRDRAGLDATRFHEALTSARHDDELKLD
jgi:hypothetical protein